MGVRSVFQHISACIAIFSNTLLILLIIKKSPKTLGSYKILMIFISIFEILYAILDALVVPKMYGYGSGAFVFVFAKDAVLPDFLLQWANYLYCTFFGTSMALFAIHFIYRHLAITGSNFVKNHNGKVITSLMLSSIAFGFCWYLLVCFTLGPFEEGDVFVRKYYLVDHDVQLSDIYYVAYYFYVEDAFGNERVNWKCVFGCSIQTMFIYVSFGIIFYFGYKCYCHIKTVSTHSTTSKSTVDLQNQLFYALVFQTIIPVFLMHLPSSTGILVTFFNFSFEVYSNILACAISLYPALDPLPNFFIIKSYRGAILEFFKKLIRLVLCRKEVSINTIKVKSANQMFVSTVSKTCMT